MGYSLPPRDDFQARFSIGRTRPIEFSVGRNNISIQWMPNQFGGDGTAHLLIPRVGSSYDTVQFSGHDPIAENRTWEVSFEIFKTVTRTLRTTEIKHIIYSGLLCWKPACHTLILIPRLIATCPPSRRIGQLSRLCDSLRNTRSIMKRRVI